MTTSISSPIALLTTAATLAPLLVSAYIPFGYQSDSTQSVEYRNKPTTTNPKDPNPTDPSSYTGSIHYDPLHHALYLTGATYASTLFDGVDVYELTTAEQDELNDEIPNNDGYWWEDMATGLKPHLEDLGVPEFEAAKGDCFYAVMGLPSDDSDDENSRQGNMGSKLGGGDDSNEVKLVHSRRFGSSQALEACSAMDILFPSPKSDEAGGYVHDFEHTLHPTVTPPNNNPFGGEGDLQKSESPTYQIMAATPGEWPTYVPEPTKSPFPSPPGGFTSSVGDAPSGVVQDGGPTSIVDDEANEGMAGNPNEYAGGVPSAAAVPTPGLDFDGPTSPVASIPAVEPGSTPNTFGDAGADPTAAIPAVEPSPTPNTFGNTGPQSRFRALGEQMSVRRNTAIVPNNKQQAQPKQQRRSMQAVPNVPSIQTRSVRLLMAGHIESPTKQDGYIVDNLPNGQFDEAKVYAFAQQVDIRLPLGDLEPQSEKTDTATSTNVIHQGEHNGELEYDLHIYSQEEEELAQDLDKDWQSSPHKYDFDKIVTSGVESRAILNDHVPPSLESIYPVSMVADPTSKKHYYVVLLASSSDKFNPAGYNDDLANNLYLHRDPTIGEGASQRSWTDYDKTGINVDLNQDNFGEKGRPNYGSNYRIIVKKMTIESIPDPMELTDVEKDLAAISHEGELIAMRHDWMQEFRPDSEEDVRPAGLLFAPSGDAHGIDDVLIMVGTTGGRGSAFGTASEANPTSKGDAPQREDLDGFITKIRTDTGAHAGLLDFDILTNSFMNGFSKRIRSNPGQDDIVSGVCAKPLRAVGKQDEMDYVYVVGSTSALLPAIPSGVRSNEFVAQYPEKVGEDDTMEAFLMKIDLGTMNTVWTVQVGAIVNNGEKVKGNAFGYGCAVTRDGQDVYLTGLVKEDGVVTDFSETDHQDYQGDHDNTAEGGTDIFVASYKTSTGSRNFLKQVGSTMDDFPSRGNGGITTDRVGNAIVTGNTRGSLMRKRDEGEYRYGQSGKDAASDIFVMSFDRATSDHLPIMSDGVGVSKPEPTPVIPPPSPVNPPAPEPIVTDATASQEAVQMKNGALAGVVASALAFILLAVVAFALVIYRIKEMKNKERDVLTDTSNLHGQGQGRNMQRRRSSTWGMHRAKSTTMQDFEDLNMMVEVRNSASGGWHGVYDDEQLQAIDFGVPSGDAVDVVEQSLFMEGGLQEIEDSLDSYEIGDMDEEVSDEDLIKAYNDAMALDDELEDSDVEFAMQGIGSEPTLPDYQRHTIT
mmetsp:Transcript_25722/g.55335  ORF Transcript_25722/g.55335 Transcript_25722/m.55335 type:complete len:1259 (+) Transcript_25722:193-3969(+)|eukprot:CAMPEP_0172317690 /NCGR_PEP_ID=MMETSP1058-20130122/32442_1 /TAXON_ID=83371 /ORGANISM="Detonula confervacea, Strain CCMP 353" /LENGTH=1258 /DNA_ID=CAMNT_0013032309 /DNA_START=135 /DNA_END=3911 /DNA_ORIENTATION=+